MRFSIRLNNDLTVADYVRFAQIAESVGFDQFWVSDDLFLRSAPIILTAVAIATQKIEIGSCILNPYTINPAEMAMMAATLDEVSGGRFNLGISAGANDFLDWVGIPQTKPLTTVREALLAIRRLFTAERADFEGDVLHWSDKAYFRFKPVRRVPIYIGALSPKMLSLVGELADGGLPLLFPPEHYANVLPYIQDGVTLGQRALTDVDIAGCIWVSVGADKARAEDVLREKIAYYVHALSPLIWQALGVTAEEYEPIAQALHQEQNLEKAKALVTPAMLKIGIAGTTHDVIERIEQLVSMGVRHLSFGPPLGYDVADAIQALGRDVIPYFKNRV